MRKRFLIGTLGIISAIIVGHAIFETLSAPPGGWPSSWTLIDTDPDEGGTDNHRDVLNVYIAMDENYLYLRLCCVNPPNFTQHPDLRYKWFIDLNGDGYLSGGTVYGSEYLFFVEDTNNDGIGDVYLLKDLNGDGMFSEWSGNYSGGLITNSSIAGYEIIGNCILLYLNWSALGVPPPFYLICWATDQENPNLEQAPNLDRPDDADIPLGPFFPPHVYLSIEKDDNPDPVYAGGKLNYTIWVNNTVGINLTNVTLIETYDSNVIFNSSSPPPTQGNNIWIFNLSVNSSWSVNITVDVNSSLPNGTILHNYVNVTYGNLSQLKGVYNETWENTTVIFAQLNPSISISKEAYPDTIHSGEQVNYWLNITNNGDCDLTITSIVDNQSLSFSYSSGDDGDGVFEPGETWIYTNTTTLSQDTWNKVNVTAQDETGYEVYDEDEAFVNVIAPSISISKEAYPDTIHSGEQVTYWLNITNNGDCDLTITSIIDNQSLSFSYSSGDDGDNILEPGETWIYTNTTTLSQDTWNKVNVTAQDETGYNVYDEDEAFVNVIAPSISIEKYVSKDNSSWGESITIHSGDTAYWKIVLTNNGDCILYNVWVNDSGNNNYIGTIGIGESVEIYWNSAYSSDFTNTANARGEDILGYEVTDSDSASIDVIEDAPNIYDPKIAEDINGLPLEPGDIIRYTAWINNTGNVSSNDNPGNEFEDEIPSCTTYVANSLEINDLPNDDDISDGIGYDAVNNKIIWNGIIPAHGSIKISFVVRVNLNATCSIISNQGIVYYDSNGDGINDASQPTDDPNTSEETDPTDLRLDINPPWSWIVIKEDPAQFVPGVCTVNIYAADDFSPWKIFYVIYGRNSSKEIREGEWNTTVSFVWIFTEEGNYTIEYWAIDAAGNEESPHNFASYVVDFTPPSVELRFEGLWEASVDRYYISSSTLISFYAYDEGSGVKRIEYKIDSGNWMKYASSFTLDEGVHEIHVNAYDMLNNRNFKKYVMEIGGEPLTKCVVEPPDGKNGWYTNPIKVKLEAIDSASGVAKTFYKIDNEEWIEYADAFIIGEGKHELFFYSIDNAGFIEKPKKVSINVDASPPSIIVEKPKSWIYIANRPIIPFIRPVIIGKIDLIIKVNDEISGVTKTSLYIDGMAKLEDYVKEIRYTIEEKLYGFHKIKIVSTDLAGNDAIKELNMFIISQVRMNKFKS